jgi:hypothetical protein
VSALEAEPGRSDRFASAISILILSLALIAPAIFNGFPLVFPDTSAYLNVSFGHVWTLDRSGFYGLALKPLVYSFAPVAALWLALLLQILAISAVLVSAAYRVWPARPAWYVVFPILVVAVTTSLPWHAAQLMPDAFAGPLVLITWMAASRNLSRSGTPLLWFATTVLTLFHYTYLGTAPAVSLLTLAVCWRFGVPVRELGKRLIALILCMSAVASAHMIVNGTKFDRWSVSPMGSMFLFARLKEDGLIDPWFQRHCGVDAPADLCNLRASFPDNSQLVLWGGSASPLNSRINAKVGKPESWYWIDQLDQANIGSIKEQPLAFVRKALIATGRQFARFSSLDDECPSRCTMNGLVTAHPELKGPLYGSRQLRDTLPKTPIRLMTEAITISALLLLPVILLAALRRKDQTAVSLLVAVAGGLLVNAAMAGALSDVHDRYQSRIVWLVPFAVALVLMRWRPLRGSIGISSQETGPVSDTKEKTPFVSWRTFHSQAAVEG